MRAPKGGRSIDAQPLGDDNLSAMRRPPSIQSLLPLISVILACPAPLSAEPMVVHPGVNRDPNPGLPGAKPYEMAGRTQDHPPLFDFTDVSGWVVEGHDAEGWLYTSQDQRLFKDRCGKLVYLGSGEDPWRNFPGACA